MRPIKDRFEEIKNTFGGAERWSILLGITIETALLNLGVLALFLMFPQLRYRFMVMNLHPLFITSAAIAIRHGFLPGLAAALVSSIVFFICYLILGLDPILFFKTFDYYKFPIMFFISGYIAGRVRDSYIRNVRNMKTANSEILEEYSRLEEDYRRTIFMFNEMKEQIVGSEYSIFSLYEIASSLQTVSPEKVYTESIGLYHKFIKANTISIYTLESGGYMRLKLIFGDYSKKQSSIKFTDSPSYMKVVSTKRPLKWEAGAEEDAPVFSAPILDNDTVMGIINIDTIEFEHITDYSFSIFIVITEWINKALSYAVDMDKKYNITGVSWSNLLKKQQFDIQLEEEELRFQKYGLPYCHSKFKVVGKDLDLIIFTVRKLLRGVDFVTLDAKEKMLEILLPATSSGNYTIVEERIMRSLPQALEKIT